MSEAGFEVERSDNDNFGGRIAAKVIDITSRQRHDGREDSGRDGGSLDEALLRGPYVGRLRAAEALLATVRRQFGNDTDMVAEYEESVEKRRLELELFDAPAEDIQLAEVVAEEAAEAPEPVAVVDAPKEVKPPVERINRAPSRIRKPVEVLRKPVGINRGLGQAASSSTILQVMGVSDDVDWQERALCAQTDPEAFFPEKGGSTREAKKVCASCEVRAECLEYALDNDERFGIWGGLSERERRKLKKKAL